MSKMEPMFNKPKMFGGPKTAVTTKPNINFLKRDPGTIIPFFFTSEPL